MIPFFKSKRGSVIDMLTISIALFIFAFMALFCVYFFSNLNTPFQAVESIPDEGKVILQSYDDKQAPLLDYAFITLYVLLTVVSMIGARLIDTNPAVLAVGIIFLIIAIFVAAGFAFAFQNLEGTPLAATLAAMPITSFFINVWPMFAVISGGAIAWALWTKPSGGL